MEALKTYHTKKKKLLLIFLGLFTIASSLLGRGLWLFLGNVDNCRLCAWDGTYYSLSTFMFDPFSFAPGLMIDAGLILLVLIALWFTLALKFAKKEYDAQYAQEQVIQAAKEATRKRNKIIASGEWEFPATDFVNRCKKAGVTDLNSTFYVSKALKIATSILSEHDIDADYHNLYISESLIQTYWQNGSRLIKLDEEKKAKLQEQQYRTPQMATPSAEESSNIRIAQQYIHKTGIQKRKAILQKKLDDLNQEIKNKEKSAENLLKLSSIVSTSAYQEKPTNWALQGGIVSGIAGPSAGVAAALDAIAENERIEARNAQNQAAVNTMAQETRSLSAKAHSEICDLKIKAQNIKKEIDSLDEKVVLAISTEELEKYLEKTRFKVNKTKTNVLNITISICNNYVPDVPDGVSIVVDGVLVVDVCCDGIHVGEAYLPFPLHGISCGKSATIQGYCPNYMIGSREYKITIRSMNVWAMEL